MEGYFDFNDLRKSVGAAVCVSVLSHFLKQQTKYLNNIFWTKYIKKIIIIKKCEHIKYVQKNRNGHFIDIIYKAFLIYLYSDVYAELYSH